MCKLDLHIAYEDAKKSIKIKLKPRKLYSEGIHTKVIFPLLCFFPLDAISSEKHVNNLQTMSKLKHTKAASEKIFSVKCKSGRSECFINNFKKVIS